MTTLSYIKVIPVKYNSGTDTVTSIARTYTDTIASADEVNVSFNGQGIPYYSTGSTQSFAKYYWTFSQASGNTTITIHANTAYLNDGYTTGSTESLAFTSDDIIFIEYSYTITS